MVIAESIDTICQKAQGVHGTGGNELDQGQDGITTLHRWTPDRGAVVSPACGCQFSGGQAGPPSICLEIGGPLLGDRDLSTILNHFFCVRTFGRSEGLRNMLNIKKTVVNELNHDHKIMEVKIMTTQNFDVPANALMFNAGKETAGETNDRLDMLAYSGKVIPNHFYWGDLIINLSGMSFPKDVYPILENHDQSRKIGFARKDQISVNGGLKIKGASFVDTPFSRDFRKLSKQDYPYQASIFTRPTDIVRLAEGEKTQVNGHIVEGPLTIFLRSIFMESSCVTFGFDQNTVSRVSSFSADSHLTLSLDIEGDFQDLLDEQTANSLFLLSSGLTESTNDNSEISDEDERIADSLYRLVAGGAA